MYQWGNQTENQKLPWDKRKHSFTKFMGCSKSSYKREVYRYTCLPWGAGKFQINNLPLHIKELEK